MQGDYLFTLETRKLDDIRALGGNSPEDDLAFATVARVSEVTQGVYSTLMRPTVRAMVTESDAETMRRLPSESPAFRDLRRRKPIDAAGRQLGRDRARKSTPGKPGQSLPGVEQTMSDMIATG